jgi:MFS family permease
MSSTALRDEIASRFRALRHRNFRLYWTGMLVSLVGTWMQSVAQGWLMHRLTSSAFMLGLLGFVQFLPVLGLSVWAGALADRVDKRRLLLITQSGSLVLAIVLAIVAGTGAVTAWMLLVLAFVFGILNAFDLPARQSFLAELVAKEDLSNAIALNSAAFNVARIAGPALAGILVAVAGEAVCFWANAVTYGAVLASLARIQVAPRAAPEGSARAAIAEGLRYVLATVPLRNLLILLGVTAGLGFQYMVLLPVYAREILHIGAEGYGLMVSAFGLGSLLAAASMTRQLSRWDLRRNLLIGLSASAVGMALFAWSRSLPLTLAMGFLAGFGLILYVASTNTLLQITTEDRFRGRVMSFYTLMFIGTAPLGSLLAGSVAQRFGAPVATTLCAAFLGGGAVWVTWRLRALAAREAERPTVAAPSERLG